MHVVYEFRGYAQQCEQMARATREPESSSMWTRMAERWLRLAELREAAEAQARTTQEPRRARVTKYQHIYGQH